jgi:hypothetical protein
MAQFFVQAALSGQAVVFHSFPSKQLVYPFTEWSHRQLASMTISPLTLVQLLPPLPVQRCQVIFGWVSVCSLPMTQLDARLAQKARIIATAEVDNMIGKKSLKHNR